MPRREGREEAEGAPSVLHEGDLDAERVEQLKPRAALRLLVAVVIVAAAAAGCRSACCSASNSTSVLR